jgi:hyperosmotically inducible periplasmic protein
MQNLKKLILASSASLSLAAVVALTGCEAMGGRGAGDRTEGRMLDDKNITRTVEKQLKQEPVYKFSDVDVKTFQGVVQLSGFVSTDEQKQRAGQIAQNVQGVTQVVNNITLKPGGQQDLQPTGRTNQVNQPQQNQDVQ